MFGLFMKRKYVHCVSVYVSRLLEEVKRVGIFDKYPEWLFRHMSELRGERKNKSKRIFESLLPFP